MHLYVELSFFTVPQSYTRETRFITLDALQLFPEHYAHYSALSLTHTQTHTRIHTQTHTRTSAGNKQALPQSCAVRAHQ